MKTKGPSLQYNAWTWVHEPMLLLREWGLFFPPPFFSILSGFWLYSSQKQDRTRGIEIVLSFGGKWLGIMTDC
jgi:hypothetical protein